MEELADLPGVGEKTAEDGKAPAFEACKPLERSAPGL